MKRGQAFLKSLYQHTSAWHPKRQTRPLEPFYREDGSKIFFEILVNIHQTTQPHIPGLCNSEICIDLSRKEYQSTPLAQAVTFLTRICWGGGDGRVRISDGIPIIFNDVSDHFLSPSSSLLGKYLEIRNDKHSMLESMLGEYSDHGGELTGG
jgi:hypothetical protein